MSITGANNPFACDPVIFTATNSIVALGTITRVGNDFTFSVGFVWKINGTIYQNAAPITITVAEADAGYNRIDNAILNTSNSIELQQGLPSNAVALQPVEPENAILLTSWDISGAAVSEEVPPIVGTNFLQKEFEKSQVVNASGPGVVIPLNIKGRNNIILNGSLTGVVGFSITNLDANPANAEYPHEGKDYYIQNKTGHDVTLKNFDTTVDIPFVLKNGADLVLPNNGIVFFKNSSYVLEEIFRSWENITPTPNRIARFSSNNNLEASSLLFDDGARIGVGAASTVARFEVRSQGALSSDIAFKVRNSANNDDIVRATGYGEVFLGLGAAANTTSIRNTVHGRYSLTYNVSGQNNSIFGHQSLVYANGSENTVFGSFCGQVDSFGSDLTLCNSSILIGYFVRPKQNGSFNEIVIGNNTIGLGSNTVVLGNNNIIKTALKGQIGIGTEDPEPSASVEIKSTEKGFLPPRMEESERDNILGPAEGLMVYNITSLTLDVYTSNGWQKLLY